MHPQDSQIQNMSDAENLSNHWLFMYILSYTRDVYTSQEPFYLCACLAKLAGVHFSVPNTYYLIAIPCLG